MLQDTDTRNFYTGFSTDQLNQLFKALDTDDNNLIDALELFVILAVTSGMDVIDKINFAFAAYDFSGKGSLTPDELTLLLKTVGKGLAKICTCNPILTKTSDDQINEYRKLMFEKFGMESSDGYSLSVEQFQNYCTSHPVVNSWITYFTRLENIAIVRDIPFAETLASVRVQKPFVSKEMNAAKFPHRDIFAIPEQVVEVNTTEGVDEVKENEPADEVKNEEIPIEDEGEDKPPPVIVRTVNFPHRSWFALADIGRPDEVPAGRVDPPQDTFDCVWIHGFSSYLRRNVFYDNNGNVVTVSSRSITIMSKNEENIWSQKCVSDHQYPITGIAFDSSGKVAITADAIDSTCCPVSNNASYNDEATINIWDTRNYDLLETIRIPYFPGVQYIDISSNGKLIVAVMTDALNTVIVFEIASRRTIFSKSLGFDKIFDVRFTENETIFAVASTTGITFYVNEGSTYVGNGQLVTYETRPAILQEVGKIASGISVVALSKFIGSDDLIAGTSTGHLLFFRGRNCIQLVQLHDGPINTIHFNSKAESIATCGNDGKINILQLEHSKSNTDAGVHKKGPKINMKRSLHVLMKLDVLVNPGILNKQLHSVYLHDSLTKILTSCLSGELLEMSCVEGEAVVSEVIASESPDEAALSVTASLPSSSLGKDINGGPILQCHASKEDFNAITGLCKIPGGFVSCGSDGTLRMYQAGEGTPHRCLKVENVYSSCCALASSAQNIFISLDGPKNLCGSVKIYSTSDWKFTHVSDVSVSPEYPICDLKVTTDGNIMAVASKNNVIYIYGLAEGAWTSKGSITLNAEPLRIDLSSDGVYIRSLDVNEELKVFTLAATTETVQFGSEVIISEVIKPILWSTNSCPCTWDVKSLWTSVLNAKSMIISDRSQTLFVVGNTDGTLSMARIPGSQYDSSCYESIPIHCGAVGAVLFIEEGSRLVTAGAYDGQVKVWKVNYDIEELESEIVDEVAPEPEGEGEIKLVEYDSAEDEDLLDGDAMLRHITRNIKNEDKFSAVKPWIEDFGINIGSINDGSNDSSINDEITVDWVFGYSSRVAKGAVRYNAEGLIVYPAATMGILYDKMNAKQSVVQLCYDQITCMEVHAKSGIAASSHKGGGNITVTIWDASSTKILSRLNCGVVNGVSALSFSSDAVLLAVACQDSDHTILLFNWRTGQLRSSTKGGNYKILCVKFNSSNDSLRIFQGGIKHFKVLELRNRRTLNSKIGLYGAGVKKGNVLCCATLPLPIEGGNEFIMGMDNGSIGIIARGDRKVSNFIPVQTGKITSLCVVVIKEATPDEPPSFRIITGGTNGIIKVLDQEFQPTMEYNLYAKDYGLNPVGKIRGFTSVSVDKTCRKILYGTSAGEIGEIYFDSGNDVNEGTGPLVTSHFKDHLHAIVAHPNRQECITIGEDKSLRVWNLESKKMLTMIQLPDIAKCACFSPNGQIIVVGLGGTVLGKSRTTPRPNNGHVFFLSYLQGKLNIIHSTANALDCITCVSFSADGTKLYAASMDFNVYVYDALNNFDLCANFQGHSVGISFMDLSVDGKYMLTTGVTGETILTDVEKNKIIPKGVRGNFLSEIKWVKRKNICGSDSVGIFSGYNNFSDITAISISKDSTLIAFGDVFGNVKIMKNPSPSISSPFKEYHGHSVGGVSNVCFTVADKYLLSIGNDDKTIIQWRVTKNSFSENSSSNLKPGVSSSVENIYSPQLSGSFADSFIINDVNFIPESTIETNISGSIKIDSFTGTNNNVGDKNFPFVSMYNSSGEVVTNYMKHIVSLKDGTINKITPFSNAICSMTMSSCGRLLVVARNCGNTGILSVYRSNDYSLIVQLSDQIVGGISTCTISSSGMYISCIGNDSQHSLYVFESLSGTWYSDALQLHSSGCSVKVTSYLSFMNHDISKADNFFLCTASENILKFWTSRGRDMNVKIDVMTTDIIPDITSLASLSQIVYSGHSDGSIRSWVDGEYKNSFTFHHGDTISALKVASNTSTPILISGSSDGINILYADCNGFLCSPRFFSIASIIGSVSRHMVYKNTAVSSIDVDSFNNRVLLSVHNGSIVELAVDGGATLHIADGFDSPIISSINHPTKSSIFVSAHADNYVRVWMTSSARRVLVGYLKLSHSISALTFNDDTTILVGTFGGDNAGNSASIFVLSLAQTLKENVGQLDPSNLLYQLSISSKVHNVGTGSIQQIKVSPDKRLLAAASTDGNAYFYDETYAPLGKISVFPNSAGTSPVAGIDFSICSRYARVFGICFGSKNAIPVKYFDLQQGTEDESSEFGSLLNDDVSTLVNMKDIKWKTISSAAAPEARGIMRNGVNVTSISSNSEYIVVGYTDGNASLFKLPVYSESSNSIQINDFSGPVLVNLSETNFITICSKSDGFIGCYSFN